MEFVRIEQLEVPPKDAVEQLKSVLPKVGFGKVMEMSAGQGGDGEKDGGSTMVVGYATEVASEAVAIAPEAPLLLTATFLLQPSGKGTQMSIVDPQVMSLVPTEHEMQSVVDEVRRRTLQAVDLLRTSKPDAETQQNGAQQDRAAEVEQRLFGAILTALDELPSEDLAQRSERIFLLSKAYTAIASLRRTEEIELHLA